MTLRGVFLDRLEPRINLDLPEKVLWNQRTIGVLIIDNLRLSVHIWK
jgi:hypothetical protein